jgi:hypothetical protein
MRGWMRGMAIPDSGLFLEIFLFANSTNKQALNTRNAVFSIYSPHSQHSPHLRHVGMRTSLITDNCMVSSLLFLPPLPHLVKTWIPTRDACGSQSFIYQQRSHRGNEDIAPSL